MATMREVGLNPDPDVLSITPEKTILDALGPLSGSVYTTHRDEIDQWLRALKTES